MTPVDHVIMGLEGFMEYKIADGDLDEGDAQYMATIVENLEEGVRLTAVMDCCHSGTALDLKYSFENKELSKAQKKLNKMIKNGA